MNEANPFVDPLEDGARPSKLPGNINTLTILTFIGVGLGFLSACWNFFMAQFNYDNGVKMATDDNTPAFMRGMYTPESLEMLRIMVENKVPIFLIAIVSLALCLYGALQMRKLLKQGYYIWLMGEILPTFGTAIFVSTATFQGWGLLGLAIPVLFIILYATQLKYMK